MNPDFEVTVAGQSGLSLDLETFREGRSIFL
jgi:hypothetical protein